MPGGNGMVQEGGLKPAANTLVVVPKELFIKVKFLNYKKFKLTKY